MIRPLSPNRSAVPVHRSPSGSEGRTGRRHPAGSGRCGALCFDACLPVVAGSLRGGECRRRVSCCCPGSDRARGDGPRGDLVAVPRALRRTPSSPGPVLVFRRRARQIPAGQYLAGRGAGGTCRSRGCASRGRIFDDTARIRRHVRRRRRCVRRTRSFPRRGLIICLVARKGHRPEEPNFCSHCLTRPAAGFGRRPRRRRPCPARSFRPATPILLDAVAGGHEHRPVARPPAGVVGGNRMAGHLAGDGDDLTHGEARPLPRL